MWNNDDGEVSDETGEPVKLFLPVQAPPRKTNTSPKESHIGGHCFLQEGETPSCENCHDKMFLMVQLQVKKADNRDSDRYLCMFACPKEDCFRRLLFDKGFSSGGQGLVKCIVRSLPKEDPKPKPALVAPPIKNSWAADNEWGMDETDDDGTATDTTNTALEQAVAAMEDKLDANGALASKAKTSATKYNNKKSTNNNTENEALQNGFGCYILKEENEPMPARPMLEDDDVGMGESDEKIRNMLARYMAEEEDEDILAALSGGTEMNGGGKGEEDERLSEEDRILRGFQDRLRRVPRQVVRYARGGRPLWSIPDKNRKSGKQLWSVPECQCCGLPQQFEFQLLPSVLGTLEVDRYARSQKGVNVNDKKELDDLLSDGMNFGSIAVFTCGNNTACTECSVVIQKSVDDLPERKQQAAENGFPSATMAIVEDLDDDEFTPDG
ncbi:MAG: hypothetical protein SGARI_002851 [Bacillariaceae sp.]